jgi:DegV family protein with EDD domain
MVTIIGDTTSSIPLSLAKEIGLPLLPQIIIFGDESYRDDSEIDIQSFINKLKESACLPITAPPPPELYKPIFQLSRKNLDEIIIICPSAALSGTARNAATAAIDFSDIPIKIINSKTIGGGLATMILLAKQWANQGLSAVSIINRIKQMAENTKSYFIVDTLEYVHKSGQIGSAKNLVGNMLQIKPILTINDGIIQPIEIQRTKQRACTRLLEFISSDFPGTDQAHLCVMHGNADEEAQQLVFEIKQKYGLSDVPVYELSPAFLVHTGPGVIGVSYFSS